MQEIPILEKIRWTIYANQYYIPLYGVWLVGILLALRRWHKHPKVSLFALIGIAILFLSSLAERYAQQWLFFDLAEQGRSTSAGALTAYNIGVAYIIVNILGWGFILTALFRWRGEPDKSGREANKT